MKEEFPVYPPEQLEVPLAATLVEAAEKLGITQAALVQEILYDRGKTALPMAVDHRRNEVLQFVPGHVWGREPQKGSPGPRFRSDVMIVDKMLDADALTNRRLFSGESGRMLAHLLEYTNHDKFYNYYVTTLLKTRAPDVNVTFKQAWSKDQLHLLLQEIYLVKPKFMLLLGADTVKAVLGRNVTLKSVEGVIQPLTFRPPGEEPFEVKALTSSRPEALLYERQNFVLKRVHQQLATFRALISGKDIKDVRNYKSPPGHVVVDNEEDLRKALARVRGSSLRVSKRLICIDCEWEGEHPQSHGAYLRCIQVSGRPGQAVTIALTHPGGKPRFKRRAKTKSGRQVWTTKGGVAVVMRLLKKMFKNRRPCGHSLKSDLEWLEAYGLDLSEELYPPETPEGCKTQGGFCTLLAAHAYDEQADLGLTEQLLVHLPHIPNYDAVLQAYIAEFCKENKIKKGDLKGYGKFSDEALYKYGGMDADAGLQLALFYLKRLDKDQFGNSCWIPYHISYRAMFAAYEITKVGLRFDGTTANNLTFAFMRKREELLDQIRQHFNWPELNLDSPDQLRELLFGARYNGKDEGVRLRPPGAKSLLTMPVMTTGRYQKSWEDVRARGQEFKFNASTNRVVLGLMTLHAERLPVRRRDPKTGKWRLVYANCAEELKMIRNFRLVNQQLKGPLRPPTEPPPDLDDWDPDEPYYEKGIPGSVCADGRVRTTMLQIKETGRWSSIKPPLQNLSSAVDDSLQKLFADEYPGSVKEMLIADEGWYLVPVDLGGAELRMTAVQSQDQKFIRATECLSLPESDPNHVDIHSSIAVSAFSLNCKPIKSAVEKAGFGHLRTGAKTVIFGKFYGQSLQASVIAVKTRGTEATLEQMKAISDSFDAEYPGVNDYFESAQARVEIGYLATWAGRYRRFPDSSDRSKISAMKREALNAGIQGGVADYVNLCCWEAVKYRNDNKMRFQIVLQKHDELMFHVPASEMKKFFHEAAPWIMRDSVKFWAADFEGRRLPGTPDYRFFYDLEVCRVWGKKIKGDEFDIIVGKKKK